MALIVSIVSALLLTQAAVTSADDVACGSSRPRELTGATGTFQSPNFPNDYPNNANCHWRITADEADATVRVEFDEFDTESRYDWVTIYDGDSSSAPQLVRQSGGKPGPVVSSGNVIYVVFTTDSSVVRSGFSGKFSATKACGPNRPLVLTDPAGSVTSPYFPSNYGAALRCNWTIQTAPENQLSINFEAFDLEESETDSCRWDYFDVYDGETLVGRYCGTDGPSDFVSSSNEVKLFFRSDLAIEAGGFKVNYESVGEGGPPATTNAPTGSTSAPTSGPTAPPPTGLFLEIQLAGSAVSDDGSDISPLCAAEYAYAMRTPLTQVLVDANNALGSSLCAGADDVVIAAGDVSSTFSVDIVYVEFAAYLIPSSTRDFITHHDCAREIASFLGDQANWVDPIIGGVFGCPDVSFTTDVFDPVRAAWTC